MALFKRGEGHRPLAKGYDRGEGAATTVRTDRYIHAQSIRGLAGADALDDYCYHTTIKLGPADAGSKLHLMFPSPFNEVRLSIDGILVAHCSYKKA